MSAVYRTSSEIEGAEICINFGLPYQLRGTKSLHPFVCLVRCRTVAVDERQRFQPIFFATLGYSTPVIPTYRLKQPIIEA